MKIERLGPSRTSPYKKTEKSGQTGGFKVTADPVASSGDAATPVSHAAPVAPVDSLLSLQEVSDRREGKRKAIRRATSMLDVLEDLRMGLLMGRIPRPRLEQLITLVEKQRDHVHDPRLETVLDEIELRAKVELAKLQHLL